MSKAKKAFCLVLSVAMIVGVFAFSAMAADQTATFTVTASETQVDVGDTITVTVAATTDYYAGPTGLPIYYDPAVFEYVAGSLSVTGIFGAGSATMVSDYSDPTVGLLNVIITPQGTSAAAQQLNGTLLTFRLTAIAEGASAIGLKAEDQKTETNKAGKLYCGAFASSEISEDVESIGQEFILNNTSVTVGTAAAPELQLSENGTSTGAIIDRVSYCANGNGFVYGIDAYSDADILDKLTTPSGSIRVTANDYGVYSTGAKIELLSASGDVVETYYFIFFGDVNGDGFVDATDVTTVEGINGFMDFDFAAGDGSVAGMAADINGDGWIDATDVSYIEGVNGFMDFPMQSETAATVAANKGIS